MAAVCERKSKTVSLTSATTVVPLLTIAYHVRIRSEETIQRSLSTLSAAVRYRAPTFLLSVRYILHIELIVLKNVLRQSFFLPQVLSRTCQHSLKKAAAVLFRQNFFKVG